MAGGGGRELQISKLPLISKDMSSMSGMRLCLGIYGQRKPILIQPKIPVLCGGLHSYSGRKSMNNTHLANSSMLEDTCREAG